MYYDLKVPCVANQTELQQTLAFLAELGYKTVALDYTINGKVPADIKNEILLPLPGSIPTSLQLLRRCTLHLADTSQNHRLSHIAAAYDIFAIRPDNEAALGQALQSIECDLISLDLSQRFPFYFKHKPFSTALQRGLKFEICYAPGLQNNDGGASRRNLISNATQLIRVTRGRGLMISSDAKRALACRAPADVVNLAVLWGLAQERAVEAVSREAQNVVVQAAMKRSSFRGVIDIVQGGDPPGKSMEIGKKEKPNSDRTDRTKRKVDAIGDATGILATPTKSPSKREQRRQAKKARLENIPLAMGDKGPQQYKDGPVVADSKSAKPVTNDDLK